MEQTESSVPEEVKSKPDKSNLPTISTFGATVIPGEEHWYQGLGQSRFYRTIVKGDTAMTNEERYLYEIKRDIEMFKSDMKTETSHLLKTMDKIENNIQSIQNETRIINRETKDDLTKQIERFEKHLSGNIDSVKTEMIHISNRLWGLAAAILAATSIMLFKEQLFPTQNKAQIGHKTSYVEKVLNR